MRLRLSAGFMRAWKKFNGSWRIISVSQSSETFINDEPIPSNEPVYIQNGQKIRLGELAQQPVVFEFQTEKSGSTTDVRTTDVGGTDDFRKTRMDDDKDKTVPIGIIRKVDDKAIGKKPMKKPSDVSDLVFDEFRDDK